jgi:hypothetical protein
VIADNVEDTMTVDPRHHFVARRGEVQVLGGEEILDLVDQVTTEVLVP